MTNPCNAKRNADDAGWSSSLSNQDKDLDNEDANKSVYKGKYYQSLCRYAHYFIFIAKRLHRAGEPSFTDGACSTRSLSTHTGKHTNHFTIKF